MDTHLRRSLLLPAAVFLLAAIAAAMLIWHADQHDRREARARTATLAVEHASDLQKTVEHCLSVTYSLAALVRQGRGTVRDFSEVAGQILPYYPAIAEIALAPGGVIRQVAPLAGNEKAVGFDLLRDPAQKREALLAKESGKLTLAGPLNLVQGGEGLVGRLPVLLDEKTERPQFWGFTLVVLRVSEVIEAANLRHLTEQGLAYELWRINPESGKKQVIAASSDREMADAVERTLQVPNAAWTLSVAPIGGWSDYPLLAMQAALGLGFSLLLAYMAKLLLELRLHRAGLEAQVAERTGELRKQEVRYRELFEDNPQPMWVYDLETLKFLAVNDAAVAHYGYSRREFMAMTVFDIRPPAEVARLMRRIEEVRIADTRHAGVWTHRRKDGSLIEVEVTAHTLEFAGRRAQIVHVNDVTARLRVERDLRASEARLRGLTEMSSDWYWETDAEHRFTLRSPGGRDKSNATVMHEARIGLRRWEIPYVTPDESGWRAHLATLDAHLPFRDFEFSRPGKDGQVEYSVISGEPVLGDAGEFLGYRGVGSDITERKRAERLLRLEHAVAARIAGADEPSAALKEILRAICESEGWGFGLCWRVDAESGVLRFGEYWSLDDAGLERYAEETRKATFTPGTGVVGRVWSSARPFWVGDTAADARVVQTVIQETGLRSLFAFPLMAAEEVTGVLAFLSREAREPDERLLAAARVLGSQIGQFLQRKEAEAALHESEARFRSLTEMSSDFYWETDSEHRFVMRGSGKSGSMIQAVQNGAHFGKRRWDIPSLSPDAAGWRAHQAIVDAHLPFRDFENSRLGVDGSERFISVSGDPVFDASGNFRGYRGVGSDITERKRQEVELLRLNEELEQRVVQRTQALEAANKDLESFSYSVSHDLRAPLRAIQGFSSMLEIQHAAQLDEQGRELLRRVGAGAVKMGVLIEALLSLSRFSRQAMHVGPVDLSALAQEAAEELSSAEPERRVEWRIVPQLLVRGDSGLLRVVMQNLIGNAWKYSSRRDAARIEFDVAERDGRPAYFVRDNGAGFDMEYADKLFGAFQRLHTSAEFPGSGIGLATVARIIHRHEGRIWAEGRVDAGATFYFSLG